MVVREGGGGVGRRACVEEWRVFLGVRAEEGEGRMGDGCGL